MEIESSKTAVFVEAIQALAKEQCDKIDRETEELRKQRIDAMQESAKARYDAYTEYETARINAEFNREISKLTETSRGQLTQQRSEIFDRVFAAVNEKLRAFVQTPAYRDLLLASAKKLASVLSGDAVTLYLRPADKAFEVDIKKEFSVAPAVAYSDEIRLGGIRAEGARAEQLFDDTLDARLEARKAQFLTESGLSIEG